MTTLPEFEFQTRTPEHPSQAVATCVCGHQETVPIPLPGGVPHMAKAQRDATGRAVNKLAALGWSSGKRVVCPTCVEEEKRERAKNVTASTKTKTTEPTAPTRDQKRNIITILAEVYDTKDERYAGGETDDSVAATTGCPPGWVADIREDLFGPDGSNDDLKKLIDDMMVIRDEFDVIIAEVEEFSARAGAGLKSINEVLARAAKIDATLSERIKKKAGVS